MYKEERTMKKIVLLMSLVAYGTMMAQGASKDEIFLSQVDLITLTRAVQEQGGATIDDIRVAVNIASGDYREEADKSWWEKNPTTACICSLAVGVGAASLYFLNS